MKKHSLLQKTTVHIQLDSGYTLLGVGVKLRNKTPPSLQGSGGVTLGKCHPYVGLTKTTLRQF